MSAAVVERADPDELILDVDATLIEIHSEHKQQAAAHFKGGYGFHPLLVFCEPLGLPLAGRLRPGNANANNAADQLQVIDEAIAALPPDWQAGHHEGDDAGQVRRRLLVRADGAGYSKKVISGLADRNLLFSVGMAASEVFSAEIRQLSRDAWQPALTSKGQPRKGALVAEVTLTPHWAPEGSRVIVRRERAHPGAQLRLWDHGGWRHQVILTNQTDVDIAAIEARHRGHANVENRIKAAKDTGLERLPFTPFAANAAWLENILVACLLLAAARVLLLEGELASAEPRRLRYTLLHSAARIVRRARRTILRLPTGWPWTPQLLVAYQRLGP